MADQQPDLATAAPAFIEQSDLLGRALAVAAAAHRDQTRYDGSPYLSHPLRVCELLAQSEAGETTLAAALLHDGVEESELSIGAVVEAFGVEIGELVAALTEDDSIDDWVERKEQLRGQVAEAGDVAAAIFAADKLANLQEMRTLYSVRGEDAIDLHKAPSLDLRVRAWSDDLAMIEKVAPSLAFIAPLRAELDRFEAERSTETAAASRA